MKKAAKEQKSTFHPPSDWWRGAIIYEIYLRSFFDSDGNGVGDLPGVTEKLDYVADLGVDAIWLTPFLTSPMKDFGYDVSDYRAVAPLFGSLDDFDHLLKKAHALGLKVLVDIPLSHTSDQHPWFLESRHNPAGPQAEWYIWADPKADGTPPNNWLSVFGGSAWEYCAERGQYYLHNYLPEQPDLNFHNPDVVAAVLAVAEFWLKKGVDGLRLDVVNGYTHDPKLRDNPVRKDYHTQDNQPLENPYTSQRNIYNKSRPENIGVIRKLRKLADKYPGTALLGEIFDNDCVRLAAEYTRGGDRLHMAYHTFLGRDVFGPHVVREAVKNTATLFAEEGWECICIGSHDMVRVASRWGGEEPHPDFSPMALALLMSLRGSPCLYQGDELGLTEAHIPFEKLQDPVGRAFWPEYRGRDGCRTPMPWRRDVPFGGFSTVEPWLPVPPEHVVRAVAIQEQKETSTLGRVRRFIAWRKTRETLRTGHIALVDAPDPVVAFRRFGEEEELFCFFNLSPHEVAVPLAPHGPLTPVEGHGFASHWSGNALHLPPYGVAFAQKEKK